MNAPVQTLTVAPLRCDLGLVPNSSGNKAAANLGPSCPECHLLTLVATRIFVLQVGLLNYSYTRGAFWQDHFVQEGSL